MKTRTVLTMTAILSSILGAVVAWLILTVPNDLQADSLLRQAKKDLTDGRSKEAQQSLSRIVQSYPRTDAAAAATVAIMTIADQERTKLESDIQRLRRDNDTQTRLLTDMQKRIEAIDKKPPQVVTIQAPPPPPPPAVKKPPAKKPTKKATPKKKTTRRRR